MSLDIARLDLRMRRRSLIGYSIGMSTYALMIVALYPSFKNDTGLNALTKNGSAVAALFGAVGSLTSPTGWLNANLYANFVPLIMLLLTVGYGAACVAGQAEDGALALVVTLPISRRNIALQKLIAITVHASAVPIVTALCVLVGRAFDIHTAGSALIGISLGAFLLGVAFGVLALLVGALTGSRGTALGVASAMAVVSYLLSSLAPVVHWLHGARFASLFFYAVGDNQLTGGLALRDAAVLVGVIVLLGLAAITAFERLDIR